MPLSADLSGGTTPLEWNFAPSREGCRGSHSKVAQKFRAVCGGRCERQLLYCGPLTRAIFRLVFRRGAKQAD